MAANLRRSTPASVVSWAPVHYQHPGQQRLLHGLAPAQPVKHDVLGQQGKHARQQGTEQRLDCRVACFEGAVHAHQHSSEGRLPLKSRSPLAAARAQRVWAQDVFTAKLFSASAAATTQVLHKHIVR